MYADHCCETSPDYRTGRRILQGSQGTCSFAGICSPPPPQPRPLLRLRLQGAICSARQDLLEMGNKTYAPSCLGLHSVTVHQDLLVTKKKLSTSFMPNAA